MRMKIMLVVHQKPMLKKVFNKQNDEDKSIWDSCLKKVDFFQLTLSFNPMVSEHWIKKRFFQQVDWVLTESEKKNEKKNIKSIGCKNAFNQDKEERYLWLSDRLIVLQSTYKDNGWLDKDYGIELTALKNKNVGAYEVYALGNWFLSERQVFTNHKVWTFNLGEQDMDEMTYGMDFGFNHPFVVIKLGIKDGELYALNEWYERRRTNLELIRINEEKKFLPKNVLCTADSAEPKSIMDWNIAGYKVKAALKGPDSLKHGYNFLKSHRFHIHKEFCPNLIREVNSLAYRKGPDGELVDEYIHVGDDSLAACRYASEHWWHRNVDVKKQSKLSSFYALSDRFWDGL